MPSPTWINNADTGAIQCHAWVIVVIIRLPRAQFQNRRVDVASIRTNADLVSFNLGHWPHQ
jgi:hypothetical protein